MSEKKPRRIHYIILPTLFTLLFGLSLWPTQVVESWFVAVPILAFLVAASCLVLYLKMKATLFEYVTREGFLFTLLGSVAITLVSSSLLLICAEATHIDNTLNGVGMLRLSLIAGAPIGVMTWIYLSKLTGIRNIFLLKGFLISFAFYTATIVSQTNRGQGELEWISGDAEIIKKDQSGGGITNYLTAKEPPRYIFIPYGEKDERLVTPKALWSAMHPSMTIKLDIYPGNFGYQYISAINGFPLP